MVPLSTSLFFITAPAAGHVNPALPLAAELVARGHQVSFATGPAHLDAVAATGARPVELPWTLDPTSLSRERFSTTAFVEFLDELVTAAEPRMNALVAEALAQGIDGVCFDATVAPVAAALAHRLGVPAISLIASMAVNEHLPLAELLPPDFRPDNAALVRYAQHLHAFGTDQDLDTPLLPMVVPEVPLTLVFVPSELQLAAETFDPRYRFVGQTLTAQPQDWTPPDDRPLLLVSLGSAFTDRPDIFRACAEAFADTDWHVLMSIGRTAPEALGELPANVEVAASLPQQAILRHATAFVSHAGMNSIMESLSCAVPLVTLPQVPEQELNARRVADLGPGAVLDSDKLSPEAVREAVTALVADQHTAHRLAHMADRISAAGGAPAAADAVLAVLTTER